MILAALLLAHGAMRPCAAGKARDLIGHEATVGTAHRALRKAHARTLRVVGPDMMVTQDYRPDRLTIRVDATNRVVAATCG